MATPYFSMPNWRLARSRPFSRILTLRSRARWPLMRLWLYPSRGCLCKFPHLVVSDFNFVLDTDFALGVARGHSFEEFGQEGQTKRRPC